MSTRQLNHVFPTLVGEVVSPPTYSPVGAVVRSSVRMEIHNTMRAPIFWKNSLGIVIFEAPHASTTADEFIYITVEYEVDSGVKIDSRGLLNEADLPENHVERKQIYDLLKRMESTPSWMHQRKFSYTLGLSREALEGAGGVVYLNDVDLVVGYERHADSVHHPYTKQGQKNTLNEYTEKYTGFQQRYLFVDSSGLSGNRWVNTGYGVFELKAINDPQFRDGVYVTTSNTLESEPKTEYYSLTDAEKALGLYRTRAEAEVYGSPDTRFKAEMTQRDIELTTRKKEMEELKFDLERQKITLQEEKQRKEAEWREHREKLDRENEEHRARLKREQETIDAERRHVEWQRSMHGDNQKFHLDMEMMERKNRSDNTKNLVEIAKGVMSVVTVILSIWALIEKNRK